MGVFKDTFLDGLDFGSGPQRSDLLKLAFPGDVVAVLLDVLDFFYLKTRHAIPRCVRRVDRYEAGDAFVAPYRLPGSDVKSFGVGSIDVKDLEH